MTGIVMGSGGSGGSGGSSLPKLSSPAAAAHILQGREAIDGKGNKISGSIISKTAATYVPGSSPQVISAGQYLSGDQTIAAAPAYSERVNISRSDTISRNVGFRPRRVSILLNTDDISDERVIVCCKYDASDPSENARVLWLNDYTIVARASVAWEIRDTGFKVTVEYPGDFLFEGYYYIHATP